ncbi:MAG: DNA helicase RecQ [Bacteroidota bacterium]
MTIEKAQQALQKYFGYERFRPMQQEIIQAIYNGRDGLVLMPTGGGKSLCFQIPAITMEGVCVVISPLISLMKDQVESLRANGIAAAYLNSSQSHSEQQAIENELYNNQLQLIYVSPEKLVSGNFIPLLQSIRLSLFAIDEAHCISSWGHDFRPEYTQLRFLKRQFEGIPIVALTATADKITRRDIIHQLNMSKPAVFIASFDRPNISLEVRPGLKRREQIIEFIRQHPNTSGIIYCLSRKSTEDLASKLTASGIRAGHYHAGMDARERNRVQEEFINDNIPVVCATVAFGMGIDKSNVRWVIHYNLPKNIEGYYQEIGRAGRDGAQADALLFYSFNDVSVLREILEKSDNREQSNIKLAKLDRMRQFADAMVCRRKVLLGYFGEQLEKNCGNCDVCKDPPQQFDGTIITQKALSAIARLRERVGLTMLIDVLRGSRRKEILQRGYDKIKTYGAGGDISAFDWQQLILQMINIGLIEVAYDQNHVLKLTDAAKAVLFQKQSVRLVRMKAVKEKMNARKAKATVKTQRQRVRDELFEQLRKLRREIAVRDGVPPYIVFSDASLEEMAAERPINEAEFSRISGVGEAKLRKYGKDFIKAIIGFVQARYQQGTNIKGATQLETLQQYKRGIPVNTIAQNRQLSDGTIYGHLLQLYHQGQDVNPFHFVSRSEVRKILEAKASMPPTSSLTDLFDHFGEKMPYHKLRFALAYAEKENIEV